MFPHLREKEEVGISYRRYGESLCRRGRGRKLFETFARITPRFKGSFCTNIIIYHISVLEMDRNFDILICSVSAKRFATHLVFIVLTSRYTPGRLQNIFFNEKKRVSNSQFSIL